MSTVAIVVIVVVAVAALFLLIGVVWFAYDSNKRVRDFAHSTDLIPAKRAVPRNHGPPTPHEKRCCISGSATPCSMSTRTRAAAR